MGYLDNGKCDLRLQLAFRAQHTSCYNTDRSVSFWCKYPVAIGCHLNNYLNVLWDAEVLLRHLLRDGRTVKLSTGRSTVRHFRSRPVPKPRPTFVAAKPSSKPSHRSCQEGLLRSTAGSDLELKLFKDLYCNLCYVCHTLIWDNWYNSRS